MNRYAVLLAGGAGTRFWPVSRRARPKQLQPLAPGGRTLLRATRDRIAPLFPPERVLVVTVADLSDAVRAELPGARVLVEPCGRNTAPAIGLAAAWLARTGEPEAVMAVLPADHYIADENAFRAAVDRACQLAEGGRMVCLGVEPTRPETGFGWLAVEPGSLVVRRFEEKPAVERARQMFAQRDRFLWNSGTFFFRADAILAALRRHLPDLGRALERYAAGEISIDDLYAGAPSISIDYGVMEHERDLVSLRLDAGWNDVGSWEALAEIRPADAAGNVATGEVVTLDATRCIIHAPGKTVALVGCQDLVVVDTPDAVLVCRRDRVQAVRDVVQELERRGRDDLL